MALLVQSDCKSREPRRWHRVTWQASLVSRLQCVQMQLCRRQGVVAKNRRRSVVLKQYVGRGNAIALVLRGQIAQIVVERRFAAIKAAAVVPTAIKTCQKQHESAPRQAAFHRLLEAGIGLERRIERL